MKSTAITKAIKELIRNRDAALAKSKKYAKEAADLDRELAIMRSALRAVEEPADAPETMVEKIQSGYQRTREKPTAPSPAPRRRIRSHADGRPPGSSRRALWAMREGQALDALRGGALSTADLASKLSIDVTAAKNLLSRMSRDGRVKREGWARGAKWALPRLAALIQRPKEAP